MKHGKILCEGIPWINQPSCGVAPSEASFRKHLTVALQNSQPLPHPKPEHYVHNRTEVDNITWKLVSFLSPYAVYCLHVNFLLSSTVELVLGVSFGFISGSKLQVCMKSMGWRARGSPRGKNIWHAGGPCKCFKICGCGVETDNHRRYHGGYPKADAFNMA